ncbi:hypothetical protein LguiA_015704 [Lonicera macranthoides]
MGSMLGDWPSFDPHNFSQLRPSSDPSNPSWFLEVSKDFNYGVANNVVYLRMTPVTYHPTHDRTLPPPDQGNSRPKRAASENPGPEHGVKHPRASTSDTPL